MALQAKYQCCDCDVQTDPCHCGGVACSLSCRQKNSVDIGVATLCGFPEFTSPSTPPKKYKRMSFSGTLTGFVYDTLIIPGCANPSTGNFAITWSDAAIYDPDAACSITVPGHSSISINGGAPSVSDLTSVPTDPSSCVDTVAMDATNWSRTATGACCASAPGLAQIHSGGNSASLDEEDTEDDAEARAEADHPEVDWAGCSNCGTSCSAFRTTRGDGEFSFNWRKVQTKVAWTAIVSTTYKVTIRFFRRILGSGGPFIFFSLEELTVVADTTSETTDWVDVPNEEGWETVANNCTVEVVP